MEALEGGRPSHRKCMTHLDLDPIRDRLAAATRGPWRWDGNEFEGRAGEPGVFEYDSPVIHVEHSGGSCCSPCELSVEISEADREFIAHSRDDIAALLDEVERLRESVEAATPYGGMADYWDEEPLPCPHHGDYV